MSCNEEIEPEPEPEEEESERCDSDRRAACGRTLSSHLKVASLLDPRDCIQFHHASARSTKTFTFCHILAPPSRKKVPPTDLGAVVPLAQRAAARRRAGCCRSGALRLRLGFGLVLSRLRFGARRRGFGAVAAGGGGVAAVASGGSCATVAAAVVLLGRRGLQEELAGPRGSAGRHVVPAEAPVDLVEVAPDVGFSGEGFEAHGAELSCRAAEGLRTTSNRGRQRGRQESESECPQWHFDERYLVWEMMVITDITASIDSRAIIHD